MWLEHETRVTVVLRLCVDVRSRVFTFPEDRSAFSSGDTVPSFDNSAFDNASAFTTSSRVGARRHFNGEGWFGDSTHDNRGLASALHEKRRAVATATEVIVTRFPRALCLFDESFGLLMDIAAVSRADAWSTARRRTS